MKVHLYTWRGVFEPSGHGVTLLSTAAFSMERERVENVIVIIVQRSLSICEFRNLLRNEKEEQEITYVTY